MKPCLKVNVIRYRDLRHPVLLASVTLCVPQLFKRTTAKQSGMTLRVP